MCTARGANLTKLFFTAVILPAALALPHKTALAFTAGPRAEKFYNEEKYDEALEVYEGALKRKPEDPDLGYNRAVVLYRKGDFGASEEAFVRSALMGAKDLEVKASYNAGNAKYRIGEEMGTADLPGAIEKYTEALDYYKRVMDLDPDDLNAKYNYEFVEKKIEELEAQQEQNEQQKQQKDQQKEQEEQQEDPQQEQNEQQKDPQKEQDEQQKDQQKEQDEQQKDPQKEQDEQQKDPDEPGDRSKSEEKDEGEEDKEKPDPGDGEEEDKQPEQEDEDDGQSDPSEETGQEPPETDKAAERDERESQPSRGDMEKRPGDPSDIGGEDKSPASPGDGEPWDPAGMSREQAEILLQQQEEEENRIRAQQKKEREDSRPPVLMDW
jgi:Ca-activated chloride channel homolog